MTDVRTHAQEIHDQFSDHIDASVDDIEDRLHTLVDDYKVPLDEARRSVENHYLDESSMSRDDLGDSGNPTVTIDDIDEPERWVDLTAKVIDLWEPRSDAVGQVGLLGDPTGTIKFTAWAKSDLPTLDEDTVYNFQNIVTDEYQGQYSVKLNRTTTIEALDQDLDVGDNTDTIDGALVDIQSGSGLIKRCPHDDCTRVLQNGRCSEHGEVDGEFDLRIKAVLDDGTDIHEVIFDQTATTDLTGITLEDAKQRAMDALDTEIVADEIRAETLGRYYRVTGPTLGRYLLVDDAEQLGEPTDTEATLIRARSI